ncbi:MAG: TlpA family protein disulfide reductase [Sulfurospirillaceae bacterium]|jgi:thiol-disulfide isomerase/thioredoxin|nr:TlpA family protein disulfide reductase [Sulfurospirillaceae bacterium]MCK9545376.1 TlpA family protein disulfide reductase [Sulfurospirillaceae bacterium]MDY0237554.1 TlpA family protein disulfide reductase [Campylobacterales bacterium]NLM98701.1 TlpA family protein disulfide reductase [Campylobacteraceae bacterium]
MKFLKIATLVLVGFMIFGCEGKEDGPAPLVKPYEKGEKIVLENIHGGSKTLIRTDGGFVVEGEEEKVLMIDIFGTFCKPCQEEAASLTNLQLKNHDEFIIIALTHLEDVTNVYALENFAQKYGAYYFIANGKENARIAESVTFDIEYKPALQVPFKVVLKDGKYQQVTDVWEGKKDNRYYIGSIDTFIIEKDLMRILNKR